MLSKVSETKMRFVRIVLAIGWLVLIASLFYDPVTTQFTEPDNLSSPFRIHPEKIVLVQGEPLHNEPYQMSARIFWTMIIPIAPIAIMLLGHEAWRRICPLSFLSQIPRYLNKNYYRKNFNRKTGKIESKLNLVTKDSWLQKNHWYLQFWLLFFALNCRILFVNSDRIALACFLLFVIFSSIAVGLVYGGKTWCNYVCPIGIVQKIYTEPGGVLESKAHIEKLPISQSMCRESTTAGDRSICVGCTADCPDIDLESSYWRGIEQQQRRFVYYAFLGLVVGFYGYYYLYSGSWDYYYSGIWTHEADQLKNIFKPGLFLFGQPITFIPKLLAVPLVLGTCVFIAYGFGVSLENLYRFYRNKINKPLHNKDLLNHVFSAYAFLTFNVFYVFGGRPNIKLLPEEGEEIAGLLIVLISSVWLNNALSRNFKGFQRESVVNSLLKQLKKLNVNFTEMLEGNSLDNLSPDEIYILGKTLPGITRNQKLEVYKNILHDSLENGSVNSSDSLTLMSDIRNGMGITDEEHNITLQELGIEDVNLFDPEKVMSHETRLRENNYKEELSLLLNEAVEKNINIGDFLEQNEKKIDHLQALYNIDEATHSAILSELQGDNRLPIEKASISVDKILELSAQLYTLSQQRKRSEGNLAGYYDIIYKGLNQHRQLYVKHLLGLLEMLEDTPEAVVIAHNLQSLLGNEMDAILSKEGWQQRLEPEIFNVLQGLSAIDRDIFKDSAKSDRPVPLALQKHSFAAVVSRAPEIKTLLKSLVENDDVLTAVYVILALSELDKQDAKTQLPVFTDKFANKHWLAQEVLSELNNDKQQQRHKAQDQLTIELSTQEGEHKSFAFVKRVISFGRDASNDIQIIGPNIEAFQGFIKKTDTNSAAIELLETTKYLMVNNQAVTETNFKLSSGDNISFAPGMNLKISWDTVSSSLDYALQEYPAYEKLLWLKNVDIFSSLELYTIAEIVRDAEVRVYKQRASICKQGELSKGAYILQSGTAEVVIIDDDNEAKVVNELHSGDVIGELSVIRGTAHSASVIINSSEAVVMLIDRTLLGTMIENNPLVAKALMLKIASYVIY